MPAAGTAPKVSVVMPVYNAEKYVTKAIDSILNQTLKDFEFIIVDDGSTDRTPAILESYAASDSRVILHRQPNCGLIATLNRACSLAQGSYIARMDADDISLPPRLEKQVHYLEHHPEVGVLGTWIQDIGAADEPGPIWPLPTTPATIRWFLMFGNCIAHPSVMARREIIQNLGYRPEAPHVEDYDLWIRASALTAVANLPEVLLRYRVRGESASSRNLAAQSDHAARLRHRLRAEVLGSESDDMQRESSGLVLKLYDAFRRKHLLNRGDASEITLDVFRRFYLSKESEKAWRSLLPLVPDSFSIRTGIKTLRYCLFYARNLQHGFTTQRRQC
ncbi:MAG TPA: glycosyltransferase [Terriglobia bacterium]|jgi:glycosyltransferase involved in cell wall biosynthesis